MVRVSKGQFNSQKALGLASIFSKSIGVNSGIFGAENELKILLEQLAYCRQKLEQLDEIIHQQLMYAAEAEKLLSIKGIGPIIAGTLLGQTGSFKNYKNVKQIVKVAGFNIVENSSGQHEGEKHISKRGRGRLRHILFKAAISAVCNIPEFERLYKYKLEQLNKKKKVALVGLSVKFLHAMFAVVTKECKFDGNLVLQGLPKKFLDAGNTITGH